MMRTTIRYGSLLAGAAVIALAAATEGAAQDRFDWRGQVAPGRTIEIKGVNGAVSAVATSGNEVRVRAEKTARRSDPGEVRIEVVEHAGGVTICAVYPTPHGERANECAPGSAGRNNTRNNDVSVEFTVEVPAGVHFTGRTVNGAVEARGLTGDVNAHTVNGAVRLETRGTAQAQTVNGTIEARIGRADWRDTLSFQTVNGAVRVLVAGELNSNVRASTVNGGITTDFPLTVQGRFGPRSVNGTVGTGGRTLEMQTVNGSIELRRQ
jgi:DUF4097 and DUF4098 domain-containing protein YvlB